MGDYRKLEVYQLSLVFSDRIAALADRLPVRMRDKGDQLRRAADGIHEAIAEGCGLNTDPQLLKYLKIALGSANESEDELHTLNRRGFLKEEDLDLLEMARRICAMLAKFITRVQNTPPPGHGRGDSRRRATTADSGQLPPGERQPSAGSDSREPQPS